MANNIGAGTAGRLAYYAVNGTDLSPTSSKIAIDNTAGAIKLVDGRLEITRTTTPEALIYSTHHSTPNSNALTFIRTRGTPSAQTAVASGDVIGKILFVGHDGAGLQGSGYIITMADGAVSANNLSTSMLFGVRNGNALVNALSLTKTGQVKTNSISNLSGSDLSLTSSGTLTLNPTGKIVLGAPAKLTITGGTDGQVLTTNGSGTLSWTTVSSSSYVLPYATPTELGGVRIGENIALASNGTISVAAPYTLPVATSSVLGGVKVGSGLAIDGNGVLSATGGGGGAGSLPSRITVTGTATALAANGSATVDITAFKGFVLYKVQVSGPAWVSVYNSSAARTADASRLQSTDPLPSDGVLAEVVTASNNEVLTFNPGVYCYNNDATVSTKTYLKIKNLGSSTTDVIVTLTILQTEA